MYSEEMDSLEFLRQFKIGSFSIFDFAAAYVGLFLLSPLIRALGKRINLHFTTAAILWLVLPLSILVHVLFQQQTPLTSMFLDFSGHYFLKAVILGMIFMGVKNIINNTWKLSKP